MTKEQKEQLKDIESRITLLEDKLRLTNETLDKLNYKRVMLLTGLNKEKQQIKLINLNVK